MSEVPLYAECFLVGALENIRTFLRPTFLLSFEVVGMSLSSSL